MPAWARINPEKLPTWARFGAKTATPAEDAGLYCKEHGVPEKFCTLCHQELKDKLMLCKEHGNIPEDICTLCHPEVEKKYNIKMCKEHGLPENFCYKCGKGPSASLDQPDDGWCAAHGKPEALCQECAELRAKGKPLPVAKTGTAKVCREPLPIVRLASATLAQQDRHPDGRGGRGGARPPARRQRRDGLRRQPLRRHHARGWRASSARSASTSGRPSGRARCSP